MGVPFFFIQLEHVDFFLSLVFGVGDGHGAASEKRWGWLVGVSGQESQLMGPFSEVPCAGTCLWAKPLCCA